MARTYYFYSMGTIDGPVDLQNVLAITESPIAGMKEFTHIEEISIGNAIRIWQELYGIDGITYKFLW